MDKNSIGDYLDIILYLEGIRIPVNNFMIDGNVNSIIQGWVDIPYEESLINITFRKLDGLRGLQPYTRVHLFSQKNNGPKRLIVSALVTGVTVTTTGKREIRISFVNEFGLLLTQSMVPFLNTKIISLEATNRFPDNADLANSEVNKFQTRWENAVCEIINYKRKVIPEAFKFGDSQFTPEGFRNSFVKYNRFLEIMESVLKLSNKIYIYNNVYITDILSNITKTLMGIESDTDMDTKETATQVMISNLLNDQMANDFNNMKLFDIFMAIIKQFALNYVPILNPPYRKNINIHSIYDKINGRNIRVGSLLENICIPDLTWCAPVQGNIFIGDVAGVEFLPTYDFLSAPTRVIVTYTPLWSDASQNITFFGVSPKGLLGEKLTNNTKDITPLDSIDANNPFVAASRVNVAQTNISNYLLDEELYMGQNIKYYKLNDWLSDQLDSLNAIELSNAKTMKSIKDYLQTKAEYIYQIGFNNASSRTITMKHFNNSVVLGFPGAIITKDGILTGLVDRVTYSGQPGNVSTSVTLTGLHPYDVKISSHNPLVYENQINDQSIENTLYKPLLGTYSIGKGGSSAKSALRAIQRRYYETNTRQDYKVNYIEKLNRRPIATFGNVNKYTGYAFSKSYNVEINGLPKILKENSTVELRNDPAFFKEKRYIIQVYNYRRKNK